MKPTRWVEIRAGKSQGLEWEWVCVELGDPGRIGLGKEPSWLCKGGLWTLLVSPHATVLLNSMMIQEGETTSSCFYHVWGIYRQKTENKESIGLLDRLFPYKIGWLLPTWSVFYCIRLRISEHIQSLSFYCGQRLLLVGFCSPLWVLDLLSSSVVVIL